MYVQPHLLERAYTVLLNGECLWLVLCGKHLASWALCAACGAATGSRCSCTCQSAWTAWTRIIVEAGRRLVLRRHMTQLRDGLLSLDDRVNRGFIEYLDLNEENNELVALREAELAPGATCGHTYPDKHADANTQEQDIRISRTASSSRWTTAAACDRDGQGVEVE